MQKVHYLTVDRLSYSMETHGTGKEVKSVNRMFRIVEGLMELDGARITELADELDLPPSTTHRYLATLKQNGYVVQENGEYNVGLRFLNIGNYALRRRKTYDLIKSKVQELAKETEERTQLLVEEHGEIIYIYRAAGKNGVKTGLRPGNRLPINATGSGKVILAHLPQERVERILDDHDFPRITEHTITDRASFEEELNWVREHGYAINDEEYIPGLRTVAVPVSRPDGSIIGAITASGPTHRINDEQLKESLPKRLKGAANEIELEMAYEGVDD